MVTCSYGDHQCFKAFLRSGQAIFFKGSDISLNCLFDIGDGLFFRLPLRIAGGNRKTAAEISQAAYDVASSLGCSYYDATFLGLARILGTRVVTAEDKVYNAFSSRTPLLLWIGDWS